ncbi:MAG: enolase C-terminal domain-like protein [Solirubrobacterales bacterium]
MPRIEAVSVAAYRVPTDAPESDGTACWENTTLVLVRARAAGIEGIGYTYSHAAAARVAHDTLAPLVVGFEAHAVEAAWVRMGQAIRNLGRPGIAMCAVSAVDAALWDLKARLVGLPLVDLLGAARDAVPIYGSGGFTSYDKDRLTAQTGAWAAAGIRMVKIKVGTHPADDLARVRTVREAVGDGTAVFVDANGAYTVKQALNLAHDFADQGVTWFEEPVSSDDLAGLRLVRDHAPMDVTAGEYGHDASYFRAMLAAGAVDVLQADATRCGGPTGFRRAAALAEGFHRPLSAHTAPALHLHLCCAAAPVVHLEWFHDHVRLESILFDGVASPQGGMLAPDRSRPGLGISFNDKEAARFAV